jgi:bifunctional non-homologous end joining protein LigD
MLKTPVGTKMGMRLVKVPRNAALRADPVRGQFVIHEHHASQLHFDLRLEIGGILKSWVVPRGPSMDPDEKRLAIAVSDRRLSYFSFEGPLAEQGYGSGEARIWDSGYYETAYDPQMQYDNGRITFTFLGKKVRGEFVLRKMASPPNNWTLIKTEDKFADIDWRIKTIL